MPIVISPPIPFPDVHWLAQVIAAGQLCFDLDAPYRKLTLRNRYYIATPSGPLSLSVPLAGGRDQRAPMCSITIANTYDWARDHWRTIASAYGRAPWFHHFGPQLEELLLRPYIRLIDFNLATIHWSFDALGYRPVFVSEVSLSAQPDSIIDLRPHLRRNIHPALTPAYHQVFDDRTGFLPLLSIIDLLMNEGRFALPYLRSLSTQSTSTPTSDETTTES